MTGSRVFELAVALMDEQNVRGEFDTADNADFKQRALPLIAVLGSECAMRCFPQGENDFVPPAALEGEIALEDGLCSGVLSYGLAAMLCLESAPEVAAVFLRRYQDALALYARTHGTVCAPIEDVYGG